MADVNIKVNVVSEAAQRSVTNLAKNANQAERSFRGLNLSLRNTTSAFKVFLGNLGAQAVSRFASSIVGLGESVLDATKSLETISTQFEVLTGSVAEADKLVRDLQEFTARTPFQFEGVARAAQQLLAFGFEASEVQSQLENLGDVSAASGADIREITTIFGQVSAAGRLTGERLLQLQERAIPIGPALAETLGVAESAVRDLVSRGQVDFATFQQAFNSLNEEGQFAFGGIDKASQTLEGRISTLRDNFELLSANIGQSLAPALKVGVTALTEFIQSLQNSGVIQSFIDNVGRNVPIAVQAAGNVLTTFVSIGQGVRIFINTLRGGFNALAVGILDFADKALAGISAVQGFLGLDTSGVENVRAELQGLTDVFEEVGVESLEANIQIRQSQEELNAAIGEGVDFVVSKYNEETAAVAARAEQTVASNNAIIESETQKQTVAALFAENRAVLEEEETQRRLALQEFQNNEEFQLLQQSLGEKEAAEVAASAKRLLDAGKTEQALQEIRNASIAAEKAQTEAQRQEDELRVRNRRSTLSTISTLQSSSNKTLAAIGKAAALTQIAIETPVAVSKALSAFPPPINFAAAAAVGAAMAAQAAKVAGLSFQDGGIVPGNSFSGDRVFARVNSGEMILNRQQQAQLFAQANGSSATGGQEIVVNTTVELDGEAIGKSVSRQVADGLELGEVV